MITIKHLLTELDRRGKLGDDSVIDTIETIIVLIADLGGDLNDYIPGNEKTLE